MRVAIYGGSFNPPHLGHRYVAESVTEQLAPDLLLVIPDHIPPHKEMDAASPSPQQRLEMCGLAFGDIPGAQISDIELQREGPSYTIDTLRILKKEYPEDTLYLVIGSDSLFSIEKWHSFEEIFRLSVPVVIPREKDEIGKLREFSAGLQERYGTKVIVIEKDPMVISSTKIREALRRGEKPDTLSPAVYDYIRKNRLYEGSGK